MESHKRSIVKAVTWRIVASMVTGVLVYLFTGELGLAAGIGSVDAALKMVAYYIHERAWDKLSFGREKKGIYVDGEGI